MSQRRSQTLRRQTRDKWEKEERRKILVVDTVGSFRSVSAHKRHESHWDHIGQHMLYT
jgi:hypothetical protein